jgi:hypothetical protein
MAGRALVGVRFGSGSNAELIHFRQTWTDGGVAWVFESSRGEKE